MKRVSNQVIIVTTLAITGSLTTLSVATDGHFLHGVGPINQSMGGAGTGAITDTLSALAWNPAGSGSFGTGWQIDFGLEFFLPDRSLSSSVDAGAFGGFGPGFDMEGTTRSNQSWSVMPSFAASYRAEGSKIAYHIGALSLAGFGVDYEQETTFTPTSNAFLTDQPPNGFGFGQLTSDYMLLRIPLGLSYEMNDQISLGFSIIPSFSGLEVQPAPFAVPNDANGDGFPSYPRADEIAEAYGIGFQIGVLYRVNDTFTVGASIASPTWFTEHEWDVTDELGNVSQISMGLDLPMHISAGFGWQATPTTLVAADVRWMNYSNTEGYSGAAAFNPDGSVGGFGWEDIFAFGIGVQQEFGDDFRVRVGYNYSQNPIPDSTSFFNTPCPAIIQHHASVGFSYDFSDTTTLHVGYYHAFENSQSGPFQSGAGPIAGTSVESSLEEDSIQIGLSLHF